MELDYVLMDPTGNLTVLVRSAVPVPAQPAAAKALMAAEPGAEQVGFLSPGDAEADVTLRMAGGEFCGNAAMSAAALFLSDTGAAESDVRVRVSGTEGTVALRLRLQSDGSWLCAERFPQTPRRSLAALPLGDRMLTAPLLRFDAIAHLLLPGDFDRALAEQSAPLWCELLDAEALGLLLLDEAAGTLDPLVYVPAAGTLCWERSCASGSAAIGAALAKTRGRNAELRLRQPGGTLAVSASAVGAITLRGSVRQLKVGTISL